MLRTLPSPRPVAQRRSLSEMRVSREDPPSERSVSVGPGHNVVRSLRSHCPLTRLRALRSGMVHDDGAAKTKLRETRGPMSRSKRRRFGIRQRREGDGSGKRLGEVSSQRWRWRGIGMECKKMFEPNTTKTSPRRTRAIIVAIFIPTS